MELGGASGAKAELAAKVHRRRLEGSIRRLGRHLEQGIRRLQGMKFDQFRSDPRGRLGSMEAP